MSLKYIFSPLDITQNITHAIKMAKSAWIKHVAAFRAAHKGMDPKKVFAEAAKTFKKQSGGDNTWITPTGPISPPPMGGGSALSPAPVKGYTSSGKDLDTQVATQHSGGKSKKSRSKKSRSRSRSHKRRH